MEYSEALRNMRTELGISQIELADILHSSVSTISRWELGKTFPNRSLATSILNYAKNHHASVICITNLEKSVSSGSKERLARKKEHLSAADDVGHDKSESAYKEIAYKEQLRIRQELTTNAIATAYYNLTHNTVSAIDSKLPHFTDILTHTKIDDILSALKTNSFSLGDDDVINESCDRKMLIKQFYMGKNRVSVKHYVESLKDYYECVFDLMQNPITYDIEAIATIYDITDRVIRDEISNKILNSEYESIFTIDAETGIPHPYYGSQLADVVQEQVAQQDSSKGVASYLRNNCIDDDIDRIIKETSLEYVIEQLQIQPTFSVAYSLKKSNRIIRNRAFYTYLDNRRSLILCAIQNLTQTYIEDTIQKDRLSKAINTLQEVSGINIARYDLQTKTFYSRCDITSCIGYGDVIENVPDVFINDGHVAKQSIDAFVTFYEKLRNGENSIGNFQLEVPGGKFHLFKANAKIIFNEKNEPYQAIIVFQDVEESCNQTGIYKKWEQEINTKDFDSYVLFRSNLTQSPAFNKVSGSLLRTELLNQTITEFNARVREYASKFVHLDDFEKYVDFIDSEKLLAGYYRGIKTGSLNYRERVSADTYRWLSVSVELAQYPDSTDIELYIFYEKCSDKTIFIEQEIFREENNKITKTVFQDTDVIVIKCDWETQKYVYDARIFDHIQGSWDDRPLCEILMADKVAATSDIKMLQQLLTELIANKKHSRASIDLQLKTPAGAKHLFSITAYRTSDDNSNAVGIILTLLDVNNDIEETKRLKFQAEHDNLTCVYNRSTFLKIFHDVVTSGTPNSFILLCCDIDNFRFFNERYGRDEGDRLLLYAATKLQNIANENNGYAGRMSNDVFAILLPNTDDILERMKPIIQNYFSDYPHSAAISGRAGAYIVCDTSISTDSMLDRAFMAKDAIKGKYGVCLSLYDNSMNEKQLIEKDITSRMEKALFEGQFDVYIQPQYNHATGLIIGAEALVRWIDPERGIISPSDFIPLFEKNGFITKMDEYIWDKTAQYVHNWMEKGNVPVPISVNVSREDLTDCNIVKKFSDIVQKYEIPQYIFRIEITESLFTDNTEKLVCVLDEFHKAGFLIEMDDFGSGYSSLNTLKDVPVDILKLDMNFFSGKDALGRGGMIVNSILRMSRWLNMPVIAEGVETKEQADFLLSIGCSTIQGYLYAKPMKAIQFEKLLGATPVFPASIPSSLETKISVPSFWNPNSFDSKLFNSFIGPAVVFEYHNNSYEVLRMNTQFMNIFCTQDLTVLPAANIIHIFNDDTAKFKKAVMNSIFTKNEVTTEIRCVITKDTVHELWFFNTIINTLAICSDRSLLLARILDYHNTNDDASIKENTKNCHFYNHENMKRDARSSV